MRQYYKFCTKTRKSNAKPIALRRRFAGSRQQAALPVTVTNRQPGLSLASSSLSLRQRSNNNNNIHWKNKNNVWKNYFNFFFVVSCFFFSSYFENYATIEWRDFSLWFWLATPRDADACGGREAEAELLLQQQRKMHLMLLYLFLALSAHVSECVCKRVHNCQFVQCWKRRKGVVNIRKGVVNKEGWEIEQHSASLP